MSSKNNLKLLYLTAGTQSEAEKIAMVLLRQKYVACANIINSMVSLYWWEETISRSSEVVLILKTTEELVEKTIAKVIELHNYECPAVVVLNIENGNPDYLDWIIRNTA
jgi:periplasmic divalent cation tolerance protein